MLLFAAVSTISEENVQYSDAIDETTDERHISKNDTMWIDIERNSKTCIFCGYRLCRQKATHRTKKAIKTTSESKMNSIFQLLCFKNMQNKANEFRNAKSIYYHTPCFAELQYKFSRTTSSIKKSCTEDRSNQLIRKNIHLAAFSKVKESVIDSVILKREVRALTDIHNIYSALFEEIKCRVAPNFCELPYKPNNILEKLLLLVPNLSKSVLRNRIFLHHNGITIGELYKNGFQNEENLLNQIKSIAYAIRNKVLKMDKRHLPKNNITLEDILQGECNIPKELHLLIECILKGPRGVAFSKKEMKINSICNSIIFSMSNGHIKPSTSLSLALVTKSITGSRKMIEILNRMGFCVSYSVTEELETELAYGSSIDQRLLPYGLTAGNPNLRSHVAFDNYDKYVETCTGKDTLHDTVGIVYQNVNTDSDIAIPYLNNNSNSSINNNNQMQRRRKYVSTFDDTLETYCKGTQKISQLVGKKPIVPINLKNALTANNQWMLSHAFGIKHAKRWFAWFSEREIDTNPLQSIGYLPNINMSPTNDAVVQKTLKMSMDIADECQQDHIVVTYDLAIAAKAYKIQSDMSPKFDRVFINLGAFHTQLSYFKVFIILYYEISEFAILNKEVFNLENCIGHWQVYRIIWHTKDDDRKWINS